MLDMVSQPDSVMSRTDGEQSVLLYIIEPKVKCRFISWRSVAVSNGKCLVQPISRSASISVSACLIFQREPRCNRECVYATIAIYVE